MDIDKYDATAEEVAEVFKVSTATVRTWVKKNYIPRDSYLKAGTTYRFNVDAVFAALVGGEKPWVLPEPEDNLPEPEDNLPEPEDNLPEPDTSDDGGGLGRALVGDPEWNGDDLDKDV
jgi:excisionase family DNA binding protein